MSIDAARAFMRDLARATIPEFWQSAFEAYEAMLPMLADVPARCWTSRQCLEAVALAPRKARTPNVGDIRFAIFQWVRDNPDGTARLPDPTTDDWTAVDHQWWAYWVLRSKNNFDKVKTSGAEFPRTTRAHVLSMVKAYSPKAFARVIRDVEAHEDALDRKWWRDKLEEKAAIKNPTLRWRELMGMRHNLVTHCYDSRPWLLERLEELIDEAEAQGADTDPEKAHNLSDALAEVARRMAGMPPRRGKAKAASGA
jgi:hypothetical protein